MKVPGLPLKLTTVLLSAAPSSILGDVAQPHHLSPLERSGSAPKLSGV